MHTFLRFVLLIGLLTSVPAASAFANTSDTIPEPVSVDPKLLDILNQTTPEEYIIRNITVTGNHSLDAPIIISISGMNPGDKVTIPGGDNFSKAIFNLWKQRLLSNVAIYFTALDGNNLDIEIAITERPRLSNYFFKGIKKSEEEDLVAKAGLIKSRVVTEDVKKSAVENIKKHYLEKAFLNVDVKLEEKQDPKSPSLVMLYFTISKGKKIKINEINFYGNDAVSDLKLKKQMKGTHEMSKLTLFPTDATSSFGVNKHQTFKEFIKSKGYFSPSRIRDFLDPYFRFSLFKSAKFDKKKYEDDKEKILAYYNSLGYRDAVIEGEDTTYDSKKHNLNINLKINEGRKHYFGNIVWKGNTKFGDSLLNVLLGIRKGDIYNIDILNKKLGKQLSAEGGDISGLYMDDGYLFFQVDPIETAVYNDTIDFEIRMREGPQATIKNVTIAGNEKTKEYVIRRELRTIPGEKFSRSDIIRSTRELSQLGYFNPEKINPGIVPDYDNGTVDINWTVEEKSADQLELSAGWGGGIGLTGTLGITFNNFSIHNIFKKSSWSPLPQGDGQRLSLRAQSNGKYFQSYNFSFTEPWLGGKKRNSFTVSGFYTKYSGGTTTDGSDRTLITRGGSISFGKQLRWPDDYFSFVYSLNFTQYKLQNYPIIAGFDNGLSTNLSVRLALNRSSVDAPLYPTKGSNFLLSAQFTPPYSIFRDQSKNKNPYEFVEFHKWRFNGEWYLPIGKAGGAEHNKQFVFKFAAKYGFMGRYNKNLEISPFERFQLGNSGLTNNFGVLGYDIIAHRGYPVYENSNPKINPDGNVQQATQFFTIFNKYTFELRYPFSLNPSSTIYGLAFFEAANGWYNFKEYNPFRLRRSVGVGMRFYLPMFGLLGFDYGIGLDRINGSNRLRDAASFTFMLGFEPE